MIQTLRCTWSVSTTPGREATMEGGGLLPPVPHVRRALSCVAGCHRRVARFEPNWRLELEANPHYSRNGLPGTGRLAFAVHLSSSEILKSFVLAS